MKYVIIGNSTAAVGCIEGIRQEDTKGSITVIASEPYHTYSRPLISYLLYGKTDEQRMKYRPDSFYKEKKCTAMLGRTAEKVNAEAKKVILDNGEEIPYDKLLIAAGSAPFIPPMNGLEKVEKRFTFLSLDDAKALEKAISADSRVLIIGAGLIGLKCAEGICDRVKQITVVDLADRILPSILDEEGSGIVQEHIEKKGIRFFLNDSAAELTDGRAVLKSGTELDFDVLVVAVGVRPNISLAAEAGAETGRGIVTNKKCETTLPDIYAAGDCAQSHDITTGQDRVLALLPNAYMQGECAGINMAGGDKRYDKAIPMNAIGFFGLHIITAGTYDGEVYTVKKGHSYKKLFTKDNRLMGYILIGDIQRAGIYTSLIREKTPLDSIDFDLIREKPQLMAFSRKERSRVLANR